MSIFGGGGSAPNPPKLKQVNIPRTEALAKAADIHGYDLSDKDYRERFGGELPAGRDYNIGNAVSNINGETDPHVTDALQGAGLGSPSLGSTQFQQARSLGQPILTKEQRDRNYFQTLLSDNPQRAYGLTGGDIANLAIANTGAQNQANQNLYATRLQGYNQNLLQNAQLTSALLGSAGSIGSAAIKYGYNQPSASPYLTYGQYAPTVPYVPGVGYTGDATSLGY